MSLAIWQAFVQEQLESCQTLAAPLLESSWQGKRSAPSLRSLTRRNFDQQPALSSPSSTLPQTSSLFRVPSHREENRDATTLSPSTVATDWSSLRTSSAVFGKLLKVDTSEASDWHQRHLWFCRLESTSACTYLDMLFAVRQTVACRLRICGSPDC